MNDQGPKDPEASKAHVKTLLEKPEHQKAKGSPEDEATRDDALDDPAHNEEDDS